MFWGRSNYVLDLSIQPPAQGSHNGGSGRLADVPRGLKVREVVPHGNTRSRSCRDAMRQSARRRVVFGDFVVDSFIKASPRR